MKRIAILVPESAVIEGVASPQYVFSAANRFLQANGKDSLFHVSLVGRTREVKFRGGMFSVNTDMLLEESGDYDLIVIPPLFGDMKTAVSMNKEAIAWLSEQYRKGSELASLCVGAFLLAATGLLNGKKCSTHWAFYNEFRETYPGVEITDGSIITEENGIYSSGGANSYFNLLLYLLEKYTDRDTAILASKYFAIDIDRENQATFMIFTGQKNHRDKLVRKAQEYIENHYQERITVDKLAAMCAVSRRSFERRFKKSTSNTVIGYLQRVKVEAAKRRFETSRKNITQVMYDVGYTDTKSFRNVFKKITGLTPIDYRNKYYKEISG